MPTTHLEHAQRIIVHGARMEDPFIVHQAIPFFIAGNQKEKALTTMHQVTVMEPGYYGRTDKGLLDKHFDAVRAKHA